jgi:cytochrome c biogenesis protein CcmG/thiol:disulfide interchange protein DsbE
MSKMQVLKSGAAIAALVLGAMATSAQAVEVGQPVPAFSLPKQGGGALSQADLKGVVYLDFWASWCGPCKHSFPWMNEMQAKYGSKGFKVVAINLDQNTADAENFLKANPAAFPVAFDAKGESAGKFKVKGMPSSYLLGADGNVIKVHAGFKPEEAAELEATIVAALKASGSAK